MIINAVQQALGSGGASGGGLGGSGGEGGAGGSPGGEGGDGGAGGGDGGKIVQQPQQLQPTSSSSEHEKMLTASAHVLLKPHGVARHEPSTIGGGGGEALAGVSTSRRSGAEGSSENI
jgi:hypothetical protein